MQATHAVKLKFEIDKKSSSNINFVKYRFKKNKYRYVGENFVSISLVSEKMREFQGKFKTQNPNLGG